MPCKRSPSYHDSAACGMRFLKYAQASEASSPTPNFSTVEFESPYIRPYAILSHRWLSKSEEVRLKDLEQGHAREKQGYKKLEFCVKQAYDDGYTYSWIDTCCINNENEVEHSEAIKSMFTWYKNAQKCYVYMLDVPFTEQWNAKFQESEWFKRGWTLQELLAPQFVEFFSAEGRRLGDKKSLEQEIYQITRIPIDALRGVPLTQFSNQAKFLWAKNRQTTKEEDAIYCLQGIFQVRINPDYGEGKASAMQRLQQALPISQEFAHLLMASPPFMIPFERNERFIGRTSELASLQQRLFSPNQTATRAVTGLGGVGKTQLLIEFLYRLKATHKDCMVLWISAATSESIRQGYSSIAEQLDIPGRVHEDNDTIQLVKSCLEKVTTGRWVLVFDDADNIDLWTKPLSTDPKRLTPVPSYCLVDRLPRNEHGCIIFSTSDMDTAYRLAGLDVIKLSPLDETAAMDMLKQRLLRPDLTNDTKIAAKLLAKLTHLPLAIVQAAAYISTTGCSLKKYLELLDAQDEEEVLRLLSKGLGEEERLYNLKPVATTWLVSFEYIRRHDPLAAEYLSTMACVHYKDIPLSLLPPCTSELKRQDAIGMLEAYSFVERQGTDSALSLHRLVHLAARSWLRKEKTLGEWEVKTYTRLDQVIPIDDPQHRGLWRTYLPHIQYLVSTYQGQGRWEQVEQLQARVIEAYDQPSVKDRLAKPCHCQ